MKPNHPSGSYSRVAHWFSGLGRRLWRQEGAELVEFAVTLPILAVIVVGMSDFGAAWALRDKLANAARDGARVAVSAPNDTFIPRCQGSTTPCSVQVAASDVVTYLTNAGVNACGMTPWNTAPTVGTGTSAFTWTYTASGSGCSGTFTVTVNRSVTLISSSTTVFCTQVTISYPFAWKFGRVVKLIDPSSTFANSFSLQTAETMPNLN